MVVFYFKNLFQTHLTPTKGIAANATITCKTPTLVRASRS